ncbi:MAG: hypothetical protein ACHQF2_02605 [Flavobacteriales bacterium]
MKYLVLSVFVTLFFIRLEAQETHTLILASGACSYDVCGYLFIDENGAEIRVTWLPVGSVEMQEHPNGSMVVKEEYLNKVYRVTFVLKKVLDEPSDTMIDEYVVSAMEPMPDVVLHEKMVLTGCDCEMQLCIFTFNQSDSTEIISHELPEGAVTMETNEKGHPVVKKEDMKVTYEVIYVIKKEFDYSTGNYFDVMVIREMKKK